MPKAIRLVNGRLGILTPALWLHLNLQEWEEKTMEPDGELKKAFFKKDVARMGLS